MIIHDKKKKKKRKERNQREETKEARYDRKQHGRHTWKQGRGWHNTAERLRRKDITVIIQCLQQSTRFRPGRKLVIPTLRKLSALCANYKFVNWQVDSSTSRYPRRLF